MAVQPAGGTTSATETGRWDRISERLHALRDAADAPSFAEIARRVSEHRRAEGAAPEAARVARSTVYDAFRPGRTRVNLALVRDIARVLGTDDAVVDAWFAECRDDVLAADAPDEAPPALPASPSESVPEATGVTGATGPDAVADRGHRDGVVATTIGQSLLVMVLCVVINLIGRNTVDLLALPVYADMIGTCVAAVALGPWRGAAVGIATNLVGVAGAGLVSLPFAAVNVLGALVWGYGVRRWTWGRSLPRFLVLNLIAAAACSAVAVTILTGMYAGSVGHSQDVVSSRVFDLVPSTVVAVGTSNLVTSAIDKLMSGFVALVIIMVAVPDNLLAPLRGRLVLLDHRRDA